MSSRRQLRAGAEAAPAIPAHLVRFRQADWPPPDPAAEAKRLEMFEGFQAGVARTFARRRFNEAQRAWAAEHGMTINDLWHMIAAAEGR